MVTHWLFAPLVLIALLWQFILLHLAWPRRAAASPQRPTAPKPIAPKHTRSAEPHAFAGLMHKPPCPRCASDSAVVVVPPVRPDPMRVTYRRPRPVDTSPHFCPQEGCAYRVWPGLGHLRANGHPRFTFRTP